MAQTETYADPKAADLPQEQQQQPEDYEQWLYDNPEALAAVKQGLVDSAAGRGVKMSFLEFADIDIDD